ncbi:unnamed protein product [Moneuplotes crassus]|uniref:Cytochrome b561 domain-containing protein n=1 Tax=Euplotes crassus TaxID=5936 RepID=A0AAD2CYM3_EUPCR|nr:unnamed protein product [Moneuplotes crassus]
MNIFTILLSLFTLIEQTSVKVNLFKTQTVVTDSISVQISLIKEQIFSVHLVHPVNTSIQVDLSGENFFEGFETVNLNGDLSLKNMTSNKEIGDVNKYKLKNQGLVDNELHYSVSFLLEFGENKIRKNFPISNLNLMYFTDNRVLDVHDMTISFNSDSFHRSLELESFRKKSIKEVAAHTHALYSFIIWSWLSVFIFISGQFYHKYIVCKQIFHRGTALCIISFAAVNFVLLLGSVTKRKLPHNLVNLHTIIGYEIFLIILAQIVTGVVAKILSKSKRENAADYLDIARLIHRYLGYYVLVYSNLKILSIVGQISYNSRFFLILNYIVISLTCVFLCGILPRMRFSRASTRT